MGSVLTTTSIQLFVERLDSSDQNVPNVLLRPQSRMSCYDPNHDPNHYTPKRLPKIHLGTKAPFAWGDKLRGPHAQLAFELLSLLNALAEGQDLVVKEIDVSHAFSPSYGQRHIAVVIDEYYSDTSGYTTQTRTLRLSPKHIAEGITNYAKMRTHLNENISKETVIDLRIPRLAFVADTHSGSPSVQ